MAKKSKQTKPTTKPKPLRPGLYATKSGKTVALLAEVYDTIVNYKRVLPSVELLQWQDPELFRKMYPLKVTRCEVEE